MLALLFAQAGAATPGLVSLVETAATSDTVQLTLVAPVLHVAETAATSDTVSDGSGSVFSLRETAAASDVVSVSNSPAVSLTETAATADEVTLPPDFTLAVTETAATSDAVAITLDAAVSLVESAASSDAPGGGYQFTINLIGPSTDPGAPQITPAEINTQVNAALQAVVAQATLLARGEAASTPYLLDSTVTPRSPRDRFGDVLSPMDFGAIGDGLSHPASTRYQTLALCQEVFPFATSLAQELDYLAWQAALSLGIKVISRPLSYVMCNADPASMTPLILIAGLAYAEGNGAILDFTAMETQPVSMHYISNYDFSQGGEGWVSDTIDFPVSAPVFEDGTAYCADPPSFCRFGQQVTLPPGRYVIKWEFTATLGGSYPGNPSPPYGEINFWSAAPGGGDQFPFPLPVAMNFPNLTGVITAGSEGITVQGSSNLAIVDQPYTGYLCFTGGGYANWRVKLLDIIPYVPNAGIWVTRDNTRGEYYNIDKSFKGFELIGNRTGDADITGSTGPTGILIESFINNDGNLVDFQDCSLHNWGNAIWPRDGAYLLEFRNCLLYSNDIAVFFNGAQNAGENIRFYGGGIFNNLFGIVNPHSFGEFTFYGTALDYNYASVLFNVGKLEFHGCHIENNIKDIAIFNCSGGQIMMYGGTILGVAPLIPPDQTVPPIKLDDSNSLMTCFGTQIYNLSSADGTFVAGPGTFRAYGWINTGNPNIEQPSATTIAMDPLGGVGALEPLSGSPWIAPDPTGIYLEGGVYSSDPTSVITNRWTADNLSLALQTTVKHTGTRCIEVAKTSAQGNDYQIIFMVPVRPGQDANLSFWFYSPNSYLDPLPVASITWVSPIGVGTATVTTAEPHGHSVGELLFMFIQGADQTEYNGIRYCTVTTADQFTYEADASFLPPATGTITYCPCGTMYLRIFWAKQIGVDAYGRPLLSQANTFKGENDVPIPLCGSPDWTIHGGGTEYGPPTTDPTIGDSPGAPAWATHMAVVMDTESLPAMSFFLDDFVAFII